MAKELRAGVPQLQWRVTVASDDPKNVSKLDANANILTSTDDVLSTKGGTVTGNVAFQGTANTFAQGSINSIALGPLQLVNLGANPTYTLANTDAGKVLWNTRTNGDLTITVPTNDTIPLAIGSVVEIVSATTRGTFVQPQAGVTLNYNRLVAGVDGGALGGGDGAAGRCRLRGVLTSARLLKVGLNQWYAFGDILE